MQWSHDLFHWGFCSTHELSKTPSGIGHGSTATVCTRFFRFGHQPLDGRRSAGAGAPGYDLCMFFIIISLANIQMSDHVTRSRGTTPSSNLCHTNTHPMSPTSICLVIISPLQLNVLWCSTQHTKKLILLVEHRLACRSTPIVSFIPLFEHQMSDAITRVDK